jgi:anthranilate phosphoribosyltransferase
MQCMQMGQFSSAAFIKDLGRGKEGARSLSQDDTQNLWAAVLDGAVSDLELGAILIAWRIKGESPAELIGMLRAVNAHLLPMPITQRPVLVIPTYNGARNLPNLVPLLAGLAARAGLNMLVHGLQEDASMWGAERVTTYEVWQALGWPVALDDQSLAQIWAAGQPAFMPIDALCPSLDRLLSMRRVLGVRNSAHTLVKLLQPFPADGLLLACYTHPEYAETLSQLFLLHGTRALLSRATEGEAVANVRKPGVIDRYDAGAFDRVWIPDESSKAFDLELPSRAAGPTAEWTNKVLEGGLPAPEAIKRQLAIARATLGGL